LTWLHTKMVGYTRAKMVTHPSTNRTQRRVTSFMRRTTLPLRQSHQPGQQWDIDNGTLYRW